jgi:tetratricopeptide (TPR) repeat protein
MRWGWMMALGIGLVMRTARADELRAPRNVNAEPGNRQSSQLASRAASADMQGRPRQALDLANQAIRADPRNPWPYYDKGMALAALGEVDGAIAALYAAEQHFSPADRWGKSVAIYGRAHALSQAGRCMEAVQAYADYAKFVERDDPQSAAMARTYAVDCRAAAPVAPTARTAPTAPTAPPPAATTPQAVPPAIAPAPTAPPPQPNR